MTEVKKRLSLIKPTLTTLFHIDYQWWQNNDRDWRVYLRSYLAPEDLQLIDDQDGGELIDLVDAETAEVTQVDFLQHVLITKYATQDDFITHTTSVTEAIFRIFLANGNIPLTAVEIAERIGRSPNVILSMLSGRQVYRGIRACPHC